MEAAMMPLPKEEATPPVTKMYLVSDTIFLFLEVLTLLEIKQDRKALRNTL